MPDSSPVKWTWTSTKQDTVTLPGGREAKRVTECTINHPSGTPILVVHRVRRDVRQEAKDLCDLLNITKSKMVGEDE